MTEPDKLRELAGQFRALQGTYAADDATATERGMHIAYGKCADAVFALAERTNAASGGDTSDALAVLLREADDMLKARGRVEPNSPRHLRLLDAHASLQTELAALRQRCEYLQRESARKTEDYATTSAALIARAEQAEGERREVLALLREVDMFLAGEALPTKAHLRSRVQNILNRKPQA